MIITVREIFYLVDRISNIHSLEKRKPDLANDMKNTLQDMKDSFKEAGENYEDYMDNECNIPMEKIADIIEEAITREIKEEP